MVLQTLPEVPELLKLIDRYHPTQFPASPRSTKRCCVTRRPRRTRLDSIRFCLSGSAPLPVEVQRQFEAMTGATVIEGYGLSETSPATRTRTLRRENGGRSIGVPLPGRYQRMIDLNDGTTVLGLEEVGELSVRGPQVMLGYYRQPEETERVLKDGWFRRATSRGWMRTASPTWSTARKT